MKRGTILLLNNIAIRFNKKDFEYDVYSLVKAFYPHAQVTMFYEGEEEPEGAYGMLLLVAYGGQEICLAVEKDGTEIFRQQVAVDYEKDRPETKNVLKRLVYGALCQVTGKTLPWGDLTGIRPTKIPMKLLEEGWKNTQIAQYMRETYSVSNEKTALAITIANRERALLQDLDYENGYSLYVGIPFCPSICLYCSFGSHPLERWTKRVDEYLDALCKELTFIREEMGERKLTTVYIGGGTPTTLEPEQLRRLLSHMQTTFDFTWVKEYTVEAGRPDSITREKLQVMKEFPVGLLFVLQGTKIYIELSVGMCYYKIYDQTEEKGMKIAVCDDDRLLTGEIDGQLQKIREKTGISFETDIFFDGETLWEAIEKNGSYDIVYLDIEMKNMDGITVARKIRDRDPYAILIFVSSYDSYYEQLFEVEPLRFLHKPIELNEFLNSTLQE